MQNQEKILEAAKEAQASFKHKPVGMTECFSAERWKDQDDMDWYTSNS